MIGPHHKMICPRKKDTIASRVISKEARRKDSKPRREGSKPRLIMILGSSHSGTTILKTILGHVPKTSEILGELTTPPNVSPVTRYIDSAFAAAKNADCDYVIAKRSPAGLRTPDEHCHPGWGDTIRIVVTRNPILVCNSWNERDVVYRNCKDRFKSFANIIDAVLKRKQNPNTYYIRYEDMFEDNFRALREILDDIGMHYTESIFDNSRYTNLSHKKVRNSVDTKPTPEDHERYRTWQINQPIRNFNREDKAINLTSSQYEWLSKNQSVQALYPSSESLLSKATIELP